LLSSRKCNDAARLIKTQFAAPLTSFHESLSGRDKQSQRSVMIVAPRTKGSLTRPASRDVDATIARDAVATVLELARCAEELLLSEAGFPSIIRKNMLLLLRG
jgi:hypothetical protein